MNYVVDVANTSDHWVSKEPGERISVIAIINGKSAFIVTQFQVNSVFRSRNMHLFSADFEYQVGQRFYFVAFNVVNFIVGIVFSSSALYDLVNVF